MLIYPADVGRYAGPVIRDLSIKWGPTSSSAVVLPITTLQPFGVITVLPSRCQTGSLGSPSPSTLPVSLATISRERMVRCLKSLFTPYPHLAFLVVITGATLNSLGGEFAQVIAPYAENIWVLGRSEAK